MGDVDTVLEAIPHAGTTIDPDELLGALFGDQVEPVSQRVVDDSARWSRRMAVTYRLPDDALIELQYNVRRQADQEGDVDLDVTGREVWARSLVSTVYLASQEDAEQVHIYPPGAAIASSDREWTIVYSRNGEEVTRDMVWTGEHGERIARFNHGKLSTVEALEVSSYDAITLQARSVHRGPWETIVNPTCDTTPEGEDNATPAPHGAAEN